MADDRIADDFDDIDIEDDDAPRGRRGGRGGDRSDRGDREDHDDRRGGGFRGAGGRGGSRRSRTFYKDKLGEGNYIDYKNTDLLKLFVTDRGKIRPRRQTGISAKQQRAIARAIKRARTMALLPFTESHTHQ